MDEEPASQLHHLLRSVLAEMHRPRHWVLGDCAVFNMPHWSIFLYFLHKETLLASWISACSMRKTKGSFQKERGSWQSWGSHLSPATQRAQDHPCRIFTSSASSLFPFLPFSSPSSKIAWPLEKKNKTIAGCKYATAQDPTCQKAII